MPHCTNRDELNDSLCSCDVIPCEFYVLNVHPRQIEWRERELVVDSIPDVG